MRATILSIIVAGMTLAIQCGEKNIAGTGTLIGNPTVAGVLYNADGSFSKNAIVHIRKKSTLADIPGALTKRSASASSVTVTTDNNGRFAIDSIDTGMYVIEGTDGRNNLSLNDSVPVKNADSTLIVPPDTLRPAGAIKGVIRLSEGGDPRKTLMLAFGIDRFVGVSAEGTFKFTDLSRGKYSLRILSMLDNYGIFDTTDIHVNPADTTDLDTIELPFTGIPTSRNFTMTYDTINQIVSLHWSRLDSSLYKSMNIYRRNVDSNSVLKQINTAPVIDTIFHDSTVMEEQTYEYRIAAVDKNATEGVKSAEVTVRIGLYIVPQNVKIKYDTLKQMVKISWSNPDTARVGGYNVYRRDISNNYEAFATPINPNPIVNTIYIDSTGFQDLTYEYRIAAIIKNAREGVKSQGIKVYITSNFKEDTVFENAGQGQLVAPNDIVVSGNGNLYIADGHDSSISIFDSTMRYQKDLISNIPANRIRITGDNKFYVANGGSIIVYDSSGALLNTIIETGNITDFDVKDGTVYVLTDFRAISIYSNNGILKKTWECPNAVCIAIGNSNKIYVGNKADFYRITVFDSMGNEKSIVQLPYDPSILPLDLMKDLYYDDVRQQLYLVTCNKISYYNTLYIFDKNDMAIARHDFFVAFYENVSIGAMKNGTVFLLLNQSKRILKLIPLF